jgi:lysophospholipase L1-like esterase
MAVVITTLMISVQPASAAPIRTVVLGDSLTYQICGSDHQSIPTREYPDFIDNGCYGWSGATSGGLWRQTVEPGWRDPGIPWASTQRFNLASAIANADRVIIGAGTNNAIRQEDPRFVGWDMGNFRSIMKPSARLVWVDVGMRSERVNRSVFTSAEKQNVSIYSTATGLQNTCVLPWGGQVGIHPEYIQADGIHLTPAGYDARWRLISRGC